MLPSSGRIKKEDFKKIRPRVVFKGDILDIAFFKGETPKFACVISKKRIKGSVVRNLVRRRVMHAMSEINSKQNGFFVIYPKNILRSTTFITIKKELEKGFSTLY